MFTLFPSKLESALSEYIIDKEILLCYNLESKSAWKLMSPI